MLNIFCSRHKPPKKYRFSTSAPSTSESADVISKVREWLNAWRPDQENIKITARKKSPELDAQDQEVMRESYEIEIVEKRPDVNLASAAFVPGESTGKEEHGAPAGDLPSFVSEISGMSQGKFHKISKSFLIFTNPLQSTITPQRFILSEI